MNQKLTEKEKDALAESPEEAVKRFLYWNGEPKPEFRVFPPVPQPEKGVVMNYLERIIVEMVRMAAILVLVKLILL